MRRVPEFHCRVSRYRVVIQNNSYSRFMRSLFRLFSERRVSTVESR